MPIFSKTKFFSRLLPLFLTTILLFGAFGIFWIVRQSKPADAAWYSSSWGYRKQITINKNKVAGGSNLSNFPILFSVTDLDLKYTSHGGKVGKTDGTDILFTSADGSTKIDHEIEKYASSTGETIIWVEVPTLSASTDTVLYIYFGNSGASDQQAVTATWDSNFTGVYHLKDGTTLSTADSSTNVNNGTNNGSTATTGMIDGGANFAPLHNRYISLGTNATTSVASKTQMTVSAWVKFATLDDWQIFYTDATSGDWWRYTLGLFATDCTSGRIAFMTRDASTGDTGTRETICGTAPKANIWYYYTAVYDSSGGVKTFYINGLPDATTSTSVGAFTATASAGIAIGESLDAGYTFGGFIDEVRVSKTARTAGWIQTEFNNQSDPASFYSYGYLGVQTVSLPAASSASGAAWYNASWGYRKQITIDKNKVATSTSLSSFPMLFSVTDSELKYTSHGGKVGKTDGTDILFTSSNGTTKIDHEIEKYASSTGETIIWVEVPTLSGTSDTVIYIYFGNSGASDQQAVTATWDSNYKLVWHMAQYWDDNAEDSTTNNNDGVNTNQISSDQVTGKIGGTVKFRGGGGAYYTVTDHASLNSTTNITASMWYRRSEPSTTWPYMWENGTSGNYWMLSKTNAHKFDFTISGVANNPSNADIDYGQWYYLTAVKSGDSGTNLSIYIDGVLDKTFSIGSIGTQTGNKRMIVGDSIDTWIDEFRVSDSARSSGWVKTEFNNQSDPASFFAYGALQASSRSGAGVEVSPAASSGGSWYNASWGYRKQITIDKNKVATSSSLSNFPMLFSVTDSELKYTSFGGRVGKTDGTDILFTSSDGTTKLSHEIEKYASSTGETIIWVKIPTLSGTSDTALYMYYGNSGAADQQDTSNVWDSNYKGVWHLKEAASTSASNYKDSTSNIKHGTLTDANANTIQAAGIIGNAVKFYGDADYITTSETSALGDFTVCAWQYDPSTNTSYERIIDKSYGTGMWIGRDGSFVTQWGGGVLEGGSPYGRFVTMSDASWKYICSRRSGIAHTIIGNGGIVTVSGTVSSSTTDTANIRIGGQPSNDWSNATIDEVRVSNIARSDGWIRTEYNNQSDPASFYAYGATQTQNKSGAGGTGTAPAVKVRGQVKFR